MPTRWMTLRLPVSLGVVLALLLTVLGGLVLPQAQWSGGGWCCP